MGTEFQEVIDKDNLDDARTRIINFNKRQFERDIDNAHDKYIKEIKDSFLDNNIDLSRNELSLINKIFDFIIKY